MVNNIDKYKFSAEDLVSLSDLQKSPGKFVKRVRQSKTPLLITERGRPTALLIDYQQYEAQLQTTTGQTDPKKNRKELLLKGLAEMLPLIIEKYKPEKILLFGSLATGLAGENSDIDLVIIKETKKRPLERKKELMNLVQPPIATDFFIYTPKEFEKSRMEKRPFFTNEIEGKAKVLYDKAA